MYSMSYSPLALANTFIAKYGNDVGIDHMKLQKLAFFTYGWWLAYNDTPILTEGPEAWKFGPVFSSLYNVLTTQNMVPIKTPQKPVPSGETPMIPDKEERAHQWIDWIWQRYGNLSALTLSDMTHEDGTPWQIEVAAKNYRVPYHHKIPDATIKKYFQAEANRLNAAA
jgi:uncharacterized phage-associated protein